MSKRKLNSLTEWIVLSIILIYYIGLNSYLNLLFTTIRNINEVLLQLEKTSILSYTLKYFITFPIVGWILSKIGSPRGRGGHIIGKTLYFLIGYFVCLILDYIACLVL